MSAATGPDDDLDLDLTAAFSGGAIMRVLDVASGAWVKRVMVRAPLDTAPHGLASISFGRLTGSLDAALALAERDGTVEAIEKLPWRNQVAWVAKFRPAWPDCERYGGRARPTGWRRRPTSWAAISTGRSSNWGCSVGQPQIAAAAASAWPPRPSRSLANAFSR